LQSSIAVITIIMAWGRSRAGKRKKNHLLRLDLT
jgi:hypothetical protein